MFAKPDKVIKPLLLPQVVGLLPAPVIVNIALTVTTIWVLALSQLLVVFIWLTKKLVTPAVAVKGVGAVVLAVPPVAAEYQFSILPVVFVAVNEEAIAP